MKNMMNIASLIEDPDFAQPFKVFRVTGSWVRGNYESEETEVKHYGVILPANAEDMDQIPEGERVSGMMCFYSRKEIFVTRSGEDGRNKVSDYIEWRKKRYKIIQVTPYQDYGFVKAFGVSWEGG